MTLPLVARLIVSKIEHWHARILPLLFTCLFTYSRNPHSRCQSLGAASLRGTTQRLRRSSARGRYCRTGPRRSHCLMQPRCRCCTSRLYTPCHRTQNGGHGIYSLLCGMQRFQLSPRRGILCSPWWLRLWRGALRTLCRLLRSQCNGRWAFHLWKPLLANDLNH